MYELMKEKNNEKIRHVMMKEILNRLKDEINMQYLKVHQK